MISERCPLNLSDDELSRWYDDDLPTARMEAIRVHSASCPACRERLAAFAEIGAGLRDLTPPPLDLARLMANLPAASPERAPRPIPLEARRRGPRRSWRVMTGAAGLAAVLLLSLFAGYLFANHGRTRPGAVARATATPSPLFSASDFPLMTSVIAMSSPSDGWAFASKETESNSPVIALHYTGGKWTRVQTDVQGRVEALTMRNANDGWLVGTNIYRYDGRSWKEVVVPRHRTGRPLQGRRRDLAILSLDQHCLGKCQRLALRWNSLDTPTAAAASAVQAGQLRYYQLRNGFGL